MKLYDYQLDAISRLKTGSILCGGVGSGKSLTALGYYYIKQGGKIDFLKGDINTTPKMKKPKDLYIITTARKRDTLEWDKELTHFLLYKNEKSPKVTIDSWNNIKKYVDTTNAFFIFDEQRVVGSGAWVKSFYKITKSNDWILLSATPGDTWSDYIPVFVANGFFKNKTDFTRKHIVYARYSKYPKVDHYVDVWRLTKYRNSILVDMDYTRHTIAHHEDIYCSYDVTKYKRIMKTRWDEYKNEPINGPAELCWILRRVVNEDQSRQEMVKEIVSRHPRVIIFYSYNYELEILKKIDYVYKGKHLEVAEWNGFKHQPIPEANEWVYLVQYVSGCEGWNCIKTDTIIFYSQNYSYKIVHQACGRIDRLNTPYKDLYYYHLKSHSSIDLAISRALKNKKKFNEKAFARW